ncbi:hypothetical protein BKG83_20685 [Mycobacteroides chelonae]|jgi:hypothetical protein|uniref:HNH endonuclease n=2 Tax=Mycobacteroides chelonae TaxID=1774 RepID=UPI0008A9DE22|nr:HNH endonuclease [Mycobacteroides chelonae]MBF9521997.1 hypothetical protein [Mycobacteroides chelonae]OHU49760.1 hypothetical protein BKG83_20685 [Mycobacteroides chelonae]SKO32255.1 Uncharacterised protein [Mycobacteroides abscessus subsp. bolletii]
MKGWVFTSVSGERSWQSNDGYEDVLGSLYVYDSSVAYCKQVRAADVAVIREGQTILGVSRIDQIEAKDDLKRRKRCPQCSSTGIEFRKRKNEWACTNSDCKKRTPVAAESLEPIIKYTAHYDKRWQAIDGALTFESIWPLLGGSTQNSIRPIDVDGLEELLRTISASVPGHDAPTDVSIDGGRRQAQVLARINQGQFRTGLLRAYGLSCAVTGRCPAEALEAAHILPYAVHESHKVDEGLLLRADIHRLFDAGHLAINPDTFSVEIDTSLAQHPLYFALHGQKITQTPSTEALRARYKSS